MSAIECIHRTGQIGRRPCTRCSERDQEQPIFWCTLLGKPCVARWWTHDRREQRESGIVQCLVCAERTEPGGHRPWKAATQEPEP